MSRKIASLQLLCRLKIHNTLRNVGQVEFLPLPCRLKNLLSSLFTQSIKVFNILINIPDLSRPMALFLMLLVLFFYTILTIVIFSVQHSWGEKIEAICESTTCKGSSPLLHHDTAWWRDDRVQLYYLSRTSGGLSPYSKGKKNKQIETRIRHLWPSKRFVYEIYSILLGFFIKLKIYENNS